MTSATIKVLHISFDTDTSRYRVTLSNTHVSVRLLPFICIRKIYYERIKMSIGVHLSFRSFIHRPLILLH